jgi:transglutaminase-like putative cysteine protease
MSKHIVASFLALALLSPVGLAADPSPVYEMAQVDGVRVGSCVLTTTAEGKNEKTTVTLDLRLRRYGALIRLRREEASIESPENVVLGVSLRQGVPGGKQLVITGRLDDDKMLVQVDDRPARRLIWNKDVVGLRQQDQMWADRKPKPGDTFSFRRYEPTYNTVLTIRVTVKDKESVDVGGTKRSLLRVEMTPDKLEAPGVRISPPTTTIWLDDSWIPIRRETELDGLGKLILTRSTKEKVAIAGGATLDIGSRSLVPLNKSILRPYDTRKITYRIAVKGEESPSSLFILDEHQRASNEKGDAFDLTVQPARPGKADDSAKIGEEYLASNHFIDCEDERIVELTRRALGGERDSWKRALKIERWVKNAMRNDNAASLVPASQIARSLRGDCRHHAFLTAAMCRAAGVPSRTAIGLLYVYRGGPQFGFHTWAEVNIDGRWIGIDSTQGKGGVSATHLKVTQHSWDKTESLTPLLPVNRVLGKLRIEVLRAE